MLKMRGASIKLRREASGIGRSPHEQHGRKFSSNGTLQLHISIISRFSQP